MSNNEKSIGQQILERIKALEDMLALLTVQKKLQDLEIQVKSLTSGQEKPQSALARLTKLKARKTDYIKEALDNLEEFTTVKRDVNGKRTYLLHRMTPDFEFQNSADKNEYETDKDTDWIGEIEAAETQQKDKNPVVSCFVPEANILNIEGAIDNTGTWGNLGANPNATKYRIWVKPGKYEIYRELKQ